MAEDLNITEPAGAPPAGTVTPVATCCPLVSTFDAARQAERTNGYDHRTNLAQTRNSGEYWVPPSKAKTVPSDPYTQDGAGWASVLLGHETELEIAFAGQSGDGCIANCTFEALTPGIIQIMTSRAAGNNAIFRVKGLAEGETTVKVMCEGAELGWVHVVCYQQLELKVGIISIVGGATREAQYSIGRMQNILNAAFGPAGVNIHLDDIGPVDFSVWDDYAELERDYRFPMEQSGLVDGLGIVPAGTMAVHPYYVNAQNGFEYLMSAEFVGETEFYRNQDNYDIIAYYYVPTDVIARRNGLSNGIGARTVMLFKDFSDMPAPYGPDYAYWTLAHEIGHALGLYHPNHAGTDQLPAHLTASIGQTVQPEPATNAEVAVNPGAIPDEYMAENIINIMARDPLNMMGYWPVFPEGQYLRKNQWDALRRHILNGGSGK